MKEMEENVMEKIHIKAFDQLRNKNCWVHFCYVDEKLLNKFKNKLNLCTRDIDSQIKTWALEEFNLKVVYYSDISKLKNKIKRKYKKLYPEIYIESESDRQGWTRVWLTDKIQGAVGENKHVRK